MGEFYDISGNESAKRAIEVAAAGGHALLILGPPGSGKTELRRSAMDLGLPGANVLTAMPCKCGYYNDPTHMCHCTVQMIRQYHQSVLRRMQTADVSMVVGVIAIPVEKLLKILTDSYALCETLATVQARIDRAREVAMQRQGKPNAAMQMPDLRAYCQLSESSAALMTRAVERLGLSAQSFYTTLRVGRTIADLDGVEHIEVPHIAEAIQYRSGEESLRG